MKKILGYSRDSKGFVYDRHVNEIANTIHTFTGGGWTTDQFVLEYEESDRIEYDEGRNCKNNQG